MNQTDPANFLKPYQKSQELLLWGATEAKRKFYKHHSLFNLKKGNLKPFLGFSWLPDGSREEIEEWRSKSINRYWKYITVVTELDSAVVCKYLEVEL